MRAAAVPMRRRGWLDLTRIDPAFTAAAAAATAPAERGFSRPVLVTADEVTVATEGGRPAEIDVRAVLVGPTRDLEEVDGVGHREQAERERDQEPRRRHASRPRCAGAAPASGPLPLRHSHPCPRLAPCPAPRTR